MNRIKSGLTMLLCCMPVCLLPSGFCAAETAAIDWDSLLPVPEDARTEPNPEERMAYNIYSDSDLSATTGRFDGFMIDFKADRAPAATYWALCNWEMNKDDLMSRYDAVEADAGAYAGLQMRPDGPKAIMAFWEINYTDAAGQPGKIEARRRFLTRKARPYPPQGTRPLPATADRPFSGDGWRSFPAQSASEC